jgi:hypothetical protein
MHGVGLALNHGWARTGRTLPKPVGWALTLLFVMLAWVLFRAPDFATAARMLRALFGAEGIGPAKLHGAAVFWIAIAIALIGPSSQEVVLRRLVPTPWIAVPAGAAFVFLCLLIGGRIPEAFIYFQF